MNIDTSTIGYERWCTMNDTSTLGWYAMSDASTLGYVHWYNCSTKADSLLKGRKEGLINLLNGPDERQQLSAAALLALQSGSTADEYKREIRDILIKRFLSNG